MSEEEFLWEFLHKTFPNDHPIIYLYACGSHRSSDNALNRALRETCEIFDPAYPTSYLKELILIFLDYKKDLYFRRKIKVKPIY